MLLCCNISYFVAEASTHTVSLVINWVLSNILFLIVLCMCAYVLLGNGSCSFVHTSSGEAIVTVYAPVPIPFFLIVNEICLNQKLQPCHPKLH